MNKKYLIVLTLIFSFMKMLAWNGNGTEESPYQISTPGDLVALSAMLDNSDNCEGIYFEQTAHIDMKGVNDFKAIGSQYFPFKGFYEGKGHSINNLVVTRGGLENKGIALFGAIENGVVKNVHIGGASRFEGNSGVASIAGFLNNSSVIDCRSSALVIGNSEYSSSIGGIIGEAVNGSKIKENHNTGIIIATGANCENIGGIVGAITGESRVSDCYNKGSVTGKENTGGICGSVGPAESVNECYNLGVVTGDKYVGGIAGYITTGLLSVAKVTICYNAGEITGNSYVGGISGYSANTGLCANLGRVTAVNSYGGGIAGSGNVYSSYNNGVISGGDAIGGIAGAVFKIDGCYNTGHVSSNGVVGGLGGTMPGTENEVTNSYNVGVVSGSTYSGGLVGTVTTGGFINNNKIFNCYYNSDFFGGKGVSNLTDPTPLNYSSQFMYWGMPGIEMKGDFHTTLAVGWSFNGEDGYPVIEGIVAVSISVAPPVYTVTVDVGDNGSISTVQDVKVTEGASVCYEVIPEQDYVIDKILVNGVEVTPVGNTFYVNDIDRNQDISITFKSIASSMNDVVQLQNIIGVSDNRITGQAQGVVKIYSVHGKLIDTFIATGTFQSNALPSGIYVIKVNSVSYKILIP